MTVLTELTDYLEAQGIGAFGVDLFIGRMPDAPDDAIALYETTGLPPAFTHDDTTPLVEGPRVQVKARHRSYANGRAQIEAAYRALCKVYNQALSGTLYYRIAPLQQPFYLRRDANDRAEFVVNFQVRKGAST